MSAGQKAPFTEVHGVARCAEGAVVLPGRVDRLVDVAAVVHARLEVLLGPVDRDTAHRLEGRSATLLARLASGVDDGRVPNGVPLRRIGGRRRVP